MIAIDEKTYWSKYAKNYFQYDYRTGDFFYPERSKDSRSENGTSGDRDLPLFAQLENGAGAVCRFSKKEAAGVQVEDFRPGKYYPPPPPASRAAMHGWDRTGRRNATENLTCGTDGMNQAKCRY